MSNYIAIEGVDGAGTTVQCRMLWCALPPPVRAVAQPSGGVIGRLIRQVLCGGAVVDATALQLLFCADRLDHAALVVRPALDAGEVVITDRCELSTAMYLASRRARFGCPRCGALKESWEACGISVCEACRSPLSDFAAADIELSAQWNRRAVHPGLVLLIDVPFEVAKARRVARGGVEEAFDGDLTQRRLEALYRSFGPAVCAAWGAEVRAIDGTGDPATVHGRVMAAVGPYLKANA